MKKITFLLFATLCFAFAGRVNAQSDFDKDGIYYKITGANTVEVTYSGSAPADVQEYSGDIVIPATVENAATTYNVTAVGASAFFGNDSLKSVFVPVGVTYLGDHAFASCYNLVSVDLPNGLRSMGNCCFQFSRSLASIVIPNTVTALSDDDNDGVDDANLIGAAFMGCAGLKEITIGSGITNLVFANGLFNTNDNWGELTKVTCYATTPPAIDGTTFMIGHHNAPLFVPAGYEEAYRSTSWWWDFTSKEQNPDSYGAGIYAIGTCVPPWNSTGAIFTGLLNWGGNAGAYDIIVSETELTEEELAAYPSSNMLRATSVPYDPSPMLEKDNIVYYVYLRSDCGSGSTSEWKRTSFLYYTGELCGNYTITGDMYDPTDRWGEGLPTGPFDEYSYYGWYGGLIRVTQNGFVTAEISDCYDTLLPLPLLPDHPATFEWIGGYYSTPLDTVYGVPSWFRVSDNEGNVIIEAANLWLDSTFANPVSTCEGGGTDPGQAVESLTKSKIIVVPTLSNGFVTVSGATAGSKVRVMDSRGRILKSETIAGGSKRIELNYTNGLYFIVVQNGKDIITEKVILKK